MKVLPPSLQEIALTESQLDPESTLTVEDGSTLNAIGRALIQMQQGNQSIVAGGIPQSQLILTRATSSDADTATNGTANG